MSPVVRTVGDHALLVELGSLARVRAWDLALRRAAWADVRDVVPAARTVLLHLGRDADPGAVASRLRELTPREPDDVASETVTVPCRYDGPDLGTVAQSMGIEVDEVVRRHVEERWLVAFAGFAPGFAYLAGTNHDWSVPRRESPRARVPAGTVALAGEWSGIYPSTSPGGWQLIGTTDVPLFDVGADPPATLQPGARVSFERVG